MTRYLQVLFGVTIFQLSAYLALTHWFGYVGMFLAWMLFLAPIVRVAHAYDELTRRQ